jgi:hypothetical protein
MRVLHVPVVSTTFDLEQTVRLISKAMTDFPDLNQIVLHVQGSAPEASAIMLNASSNPSFRLQNNCLTGFRREIESLCLAALRISLLKNTECVFACN